MEDNVNKYSLGYSHGVEQARAVVDLEHRLKWIEGRTRVLSWASAIAATLTAFTVLWKIPFLRNIFSRRAEEKEFLQWKMGKKKAEEEDEALEFNAAVDKEQPKPRKFRRHAREFNLEKLGE
jgi:hypothetical protein